MSVSCTKDFQITVDDPISEPSAYWKLDEASGSARNDSIGTNHLTEDLAPVPSATGKIGDAASFVSGSGNYLADETPVGLTWTYATGITAAGWLNYETFDMNNEGVPFEVSRFSGFLRYLFRFFHLQFDNGLRFEVNLFGSATAFIDVPIADIPVGSFFFFRFWVDPADNKLKARINEGTLLISAVTLTPATAGAATAVRMQPEINTNLLVDEVGLWMKVLTDAEGASLYNGGAGRTYPFS